jgi:hypothetical protein
MGNRSRKIQLRLYDPPRIKHAVQLGPPEPDCGVACLEMLAQTDYTDAWLTANTVAPRCRDGACPRKTSSTRLRT